MRIKARPEWVPGNKGGDLVIVTRRRWLRIALYAGTPPGSHIGFWHTRAGAMRGVNLRVGRRYSGPCVTLFAHTRPTERRESVGKGS